MASRNGTYLNSLGGNSDIVSLVNGMSPGIYNASMLIRNKILSKNIGKYAMYDETIAPSGGNYIGEGYENISELRPTPLGKGGLMGYTHETDLPDTDFLMRNRNIKTANFDFDDTALIKKSLEEVENMQPWGDQLYGRSDAATEGNSVKFKDYTEYMKSMFRYGLSFEKSVTNTINGLMFNGYMPNKTLVNDITNFIDGHQGTILDLVPVDWSLGDTELGYVGKKMTQNQRYLRSDALTGPITPGLSLGYYETLDGTIKKKGNVDGGSWLDKTQDNGNFIQETGLGSWDESADITTKARYYNRSRVSGKATNTRPTYENPYLKVRNTDDNSGLSINSKIDNYRDFDIQYSPIDKTTPNNFGYRFYNEGDIAEAENGSISITGDDTSVYGGNIRSTIGNPYNAKSSLLQKTRQLFNDHKINTLVSRFHTSVPDNPDSAEPQEIQTATNSEFGLSHGRNLLKKGNARYGSDNGYTNPYCRVWTYHHQYSRVDNLIRPFSGEPIEELQKNYNGRPILTDSASTWSSKTVLNKNGFVNIAPMRDAAGKKSVNIKQCMFSIENLAWKDIPNKEKNIAGEEGPLGGRIMWFPPYDLTITENSNPSWTKNDFIGRGEGIYTYANTERTGNIQFTIVADHPSVVDYWMKNHSNGDGFEDKEEAQQDLLRFYAGCANLELDDIVVPGGNLYEESGNTEDTQSTVDPTIEVKSLPNENNSFSFALYYPNNLSGKDYFGEPQKMVSYLMYGEHKKSNIIIDGLSVYDNNIENTPDETSFSGTPVGYEVKTSGNGITNDDMLEMISDSMVYWESQDNKAKEPNSRLVWGYGRDKDTAGQKLKTGRNKNNKNESAYIDLTTSGLNSKAGNGLSCSFTDFYVAFQLKNKNNGIKSHCNATRADEVYEALVTNLQRSTTEGGNHKNVKRKIHFSVKGGASSHGDPSLNQGLATNRKEFLKRWIMSVGGKDWEYTDIEEKDIPNVDKIYDPSYIDAKSARRAIAFVWWEDEVIETTTPTTAQTRASESSSTTNKTPMTAAIKASDIRYKDEYTFFKELSVNEPFLYKNIIDKVKYFDPAFHAITPEGFNSRLAFLHQCTRQGPTIEGNTQIGSSYAGNLAFGRPPVCVLRLGDFYNTRILINNLSISYEGGQWDLNPESVGVQPILAKINIGFIFQGGSSLGGPVTRLQNAISFNYYANQEVYDDRADVMVYKDNGEIDHSVSKVWVPFNNGESGETKIRNEETLTPGQNAPMAGEIETVESERQAIQVRDAQNEIEDPDSSTMSGVTSAITRAVNTLTSSCASPSSVLKDGATFQNVFEAYKETNSKNLLLDLNSRNCSMGAWLEVASSDAIADAMSKDPSFRVGNVDKCFTLPNFNEILAAYNPNGTSVFDLGASKNTAILNAITPSTAPEAPKAAAQVIRSVIENSYEGSDTAAVVSRVGFSIDYDDEKNEPIVEIIPNTPADRYRTAIENDYALSSLGDWVLQFCKKMEFIN